MKSFVLGALVARVASQENVSCVIPEGDEDLWDNKSLSDSDFEITDAASCKKAVDADVKDYSEMPDPENVDLCYHAAVQARPPLAMLKLVLNAFTS